MKFKDIKNNVISIDEICSLIQEIYEYNIYVGTDSQTHKDKKQVLYVTCIVLYKKGKGGRIFICKEWDRIVKLGQRLMTETWKSLQTAFILKEILPNNVDIVVHLDVNSKEDEKSSRYCQELVGMVTGQGFKCFIKPDSFAAMNVADKYSK